MNNESLLAILGALSGVVLSVIASRILNVFKNTDSVPTLSAQLEALRAQISEIKVIVSNIYKISEDVAVLKRDHETMWDRIDELRRSHTELHGEVYQRGKS